MPLSIFMLGLSVLTSAGLFLLDFNGYFSKRKDAVALLKEARGFVRVLPSDSLSWNMARTGTRLSVNDTVATGEGSFARVEFLNAGGEVVSVNAGSMFTVSGALSDLKLNFVSGHTLLNHRDTPTNVATAREQTIEGDRHGQRYGTVKHMTLKSPDKTLADGGRILSQKDLPPIANVLGPKNDEVVGVGDGQDPQLVWKLTEKEKIAASSYAFEVALRLEGASDALILKTRDSTVGIGRVPPGHYLWSVRTLNSEGVRSPASVARWIDVQLMANISKPKALPVKVKSSSHE